MYKAILSLHSYWAFIVIVVLVCAVINAANKSIRNGYYNSKDFSISLITLIVSHIQLLIGLLLYFSSPRLRIFSDLGFSAVMKDPINRLYLVEHPMINIVVVTLITIGYSKHKRKLTSFPKLKTISLFYSIALVLLLSRIPWHSWLG